jgi:hypothetical protein
MRNHCSTQQRKNVRLIFRIGIFSCTCWKRIGCQEKGILSPGIICFLFESFAKNERWEQALLQRFLFFSFFFLVQRKNFRYFSVKHSQGRGVGGGGIEGLSSLSWYLSHSYYEKLLCFSVYLSLSISMMIIIWSSSRKKVWHAKIKNSRLSHEQKPPFSDLLWEIHFYFLFVEFMTCHSKTSLKYFHLIIRNALSSY